MGQCTRADEGDEAERARRLEALFDAHSGRVFAYAARRSSPQDADDVVGETFLVAWRRLDAVPPDALPWLLGVARKVLSNRRRGLLRLDRFAAELAAWLREVPGADPAGEVPTRLDVLSALASLPRKQGEALTLTAWDGLDIAAGAAAAGCSRATFSVRLHRARRRMMKDLDLTGHVMAGPGAGDPPGKRAAEERTEEARRR